LKARAKIITPLSINIEQKFELFYNKYRDRFVRYAYYYINDSQTAEDIVQDAILYYWENKEKISSETDALGYIMLTIKNKCLNYLKRLQVENEYKRQCTKLHEWEIKTRIMTLEAPTYNDIFTKETAKIINQSLTKLPPQTARIFVENRLNNKTRKRIAQEMGVSLQKIDYHINKANRLLCSVLKGVLS
jgi:RNA polymerase sigma-70 factor (ECF subfamily)